jgi:hypothetical protein
VARTLVALAFLCAVPCAQAADGATPSIRIPHVTRAPRLEDFLNGTAREAETVVTDFRQMDPGDGDPVSQPTTAYVSYDDRNLYVVFVCKDEPGKIRARKAKRKDIVTDDRITINIDTFDDHRHAYFFDANLYGIQLDGITTEGVGDDFSFETVWYSEGRRTSDGYIVYERIPFRSMRFPNTDRQTWGIILARYIGRNNEWSMWPYVTRRKFPQWIAQFGHMEGLENISPGRNLQFMPHGLLSRASFLDQPTGAAPRFRSQTDARGGLDAKAVVNDAFTFDVALNPDYSQVESDEPQVTVNQRYEVYFPEKRPFFMENVGYFATPENLFFSRRIVDPQFGVRVTGKSGPWTIGGLVADDRAPGAVVASGDPLSGRRAVDGVLRVMRDVGKDSHVGLLATSADFGSASNRVVSLDTRIRLKGTWFFAGQATTTETRLQNGKRQAGPGYYGALSYASRKLNYSTSYTDRSPTFYSELGYIPRVDIREVKNTVDYSWRPEGGTVVRFGPSLTVLGNWNRAGRMQDWRVEPAFSIELTRLTTFKVSRAESFELYNGFGFRKHESKATLSTEWSKSAALTAEYARGIGVNYYPAAGLAPSSGEADNTSLSLTLRPRPHIRLDETYLYSRLGTGGTSVFNNHVARSKVNYQFSRELSLRTILDYNGRLPNTGLFSLDAAKRLGYDVLLTYMLHPGTAFYAGCTDVYENVYLNPALSPRLQRTLFPGTSTGRQFFVKLSYLLRY